MTEVPIVFPSLFPAAHRFIVDDVSSTVQQCTAETRTSRSSAESSLSEDYGSYAVLCGSSSMSSLKLESSSTTAILTTSALPEDSGILVVALSACHNGDSPTTVELDLRSKTKVYGTTVRAQAFVDVRDDLEFIRLVLVADNAVVLVVWLQPETLEPVETDVVNIKDLVDHPSVQARISGSKVQRTMVGFTAPSVMIVALSPLLMCVNLDTRKFKSWNEAQCQQSAVGSVMNLIFGQVGVEGDATDLGDVSALCVSTTEKPLLDPTYIFTLHSDCRIRRWTIQDESLLPSEVHRIGIDDLPNSRDWSDAHNSAYLSARLYGEVYILAVHIQTAYPSMDAGGSEASNNHVFVVSGYQDCRGQGPETNSQELDVPISATSLVDMDFVPTMSNCSLVAMFRSTTDDQFRASTTLTLRYPPSVVSIVSSKPAIDPTEYLIDGVAQTERARIESLVFNDELEGLTSTSCLSLDEELHEMDSRFMKYLFRPSYPRGNALVTAPEDRHIRKAIRKVVYGRMRHLKSEGLTIQLETLRAMQEWCATENRKILTMPSRQNVVGMEGMAMVDQASRAPKLSAMSVYDSYVAFAGEDDEGGMEGDETQETEESLLESIEGERARLLELHASRWRRLLLAVWEEEQSVRLPLGLFMLPGTSGENPASAVLVRAGFTSTLVGSLSSNTDSIDALVELDEAALKLIKLIESDHDACKKMFTIEQRLWNNIATVQAEDVVPSDFAEELSQVVDSAFDLAFDSSGGDAPLFSVREQEQLGRSLDDAISLDDLLASLEQIPLTRGLPGLNLLNNAEGPVLGNQGHQCENSHLRQAVNGLSVRCIDSCRRLLLARYMLMLHLLRASHVTTASFYLYVRSLAVMWVGSQQVALLYASKASPVVRKGKRPRTLVSSTRMTTTCLDALCASLQPELSGLSPTRAIVSLSREMYCRLLKSTSRSSILPELFALPQSYSHGAVADYPQLALRLMTPLVALASKSEPPNITVARKETLAQCILLLVDSDKRMSPDTKSAMRVKACELLALTNSGPGNLQQVTAALETLRPSEPLTRAITDQDKLALAQQLQGLIYGSESEIRNEVVRLVDLESVKFHFSCLLQGSQSDIGVDAQDALKLLSNKFLFLSRLIRRVDILQGHVSMDQDTNDLILAFIKGAIGDLNDLFPSDFVAQMPENLGLYNRLFQVAVTAREWDQAYDACLNNPSFRHRIDNFKTLLNSMVDAGAMGEMLSKFSALTTPSSQSQLMGSLDLYEFAVDTLEERCSQDLYSIRANAEDAFKAAPDYTGSLYSLHVSRGEWRRAAQSLDLRFTNALRCLERKSSQKSHETKSLVTKERLIVEDVVLASVAAANALSLVDDKAAQFIISGDDSEGFGFGREPELRSAGVKAGSNVARLEKFVTFSDLQLWSICSLAFRKLSVDSSVDFSAWNIRQAGTAVLAVDGSAIDRLADGGYILCRVLLSVAMTKTCSLASEGHKMFQDSLDELLSRNLPSVSLESSTSMSRPSLSQLRDALGGMSIDPADTPFVVTSRLKNHNQRIRSSSDAISSVLLQKLTCLQTDAEHPYALLVAERFLKYGKSGQIPCWLEHLLIGGTSSGSALSGNLFDGQHEHGASPQYPGDPSALLSLYLRQGMLLEACRVVCALLDQQLPNPSHSRLPEKGEICFVPHKKIDILWNLIDRALSKTGIDEAAKGKLRHARELIGHALEQHFERIKSGEMGIRSMRALNRPTGIGFSFQ